MKKTALLIVLLVLLTALSACRTQGPGKHPSGTSQPTWTQPIVTEKEEEKPVFTVTMGDQEVAPNAYYTWVGDYGDTEGVLPMLKTYSRDLPMLSYAENVSYSVLNGGAVSHVRVFDLDGNELSEKGAKELPELPARGIFYVVVGVVWDDGETITGCEFPFRVVRNMPFFALDNGELLPMKEILVSEGHYDAESGEWIGTSYVDSMSELPALVADLVAVDFSEYSEEFLMERSESTAIYIYDETFETQVSSASSMADVPANVLEGTWYAVLEISVESENEVKNYWYVMKFVV